MRNQRPALFRGRHFADESIVLCVRWYLHSSRSDRDTEELMTERNLNLDHAFAATVRDDEIEEIANIDCVYALIWLVAVLHVLVG